MYVQIALIWLSSFLFIIYGLYEIISGGTKDSNDAPGYVLISLFTAETLFTIQHILFVAQYARVAALIPLVIQYNSAAIIRKKQQYTCLITFGEWAMISYIVAAWFI